MKRSSLPEEDYRTILRELAASSAVTPEEMEANLRLIIDRLWSSEDEEVMLFCHLVLDGGVPPTPNELLSLLVQCILHGMSERDAQP